MRGRLYAGVIKKSMFVLAVVTGLAGGVGVVKAQDSKKVMVRMDWVISAYHAPFFVGVKNGYYKEQGLDVTVQPGNGSGNVAQTIGNGNGDFATVDGGTMMQLVAKGLPVKAVMGWFQRSPIGIIYNVKSGIRKPKDIEGKTLVLTNGDAPSALLPAFAKATGIEISKVSIVSTDPSSKNAVVISGKADAVVTFSFLAVPILEAAGLKVGTLDYANYGVNVPGLVVIANIKYLEENPGTVTKFVRATRKAIQWTTEHPQKAIDILVEMNPNQKILTKTAVPILKASFNLLHTKKTADKPVGVMAREDWAKAEDILAEYVGLKKGQSPDRYFTNEFVSAK